MMVKIIAGVVGVLLSLVGTLSLFMGSSESTEEPAEKGKKGFAKLIFVIIILFTGWILLGYSGFFEGGSSSSLVDPIRRP